MEKKPDLTMGIIGNPSVGKTRLFDLLTGSHQHIGKTVEKREGGLDFGGKEIRVVDLPGTYSLNAYSEDEMVTSAFIAKEKPEAILQIIDARNLERNLFMSVRLIELDAPLVIALNLLDLAEAKGISIDVDKLSSLLGVPVVAIDVKHKRGIDQLLTTILRRKGLAAEEGWKLSYGEEVEEEMEKIKAILAGDQDFEADDLDRLSLGWLEGEPTARRLLGDKPYAAQLAAAKEKSVRHLEAVMGADLATVLARERYGFIGGLARECISRRTGAKGRTITEKLDRVALDRTWGVPLFLLVVLSVFEISFSFSQPLSELIWKVSSLLSAPLSSLLYAWGFSAWTVSLLVNGVLGGVTTELSFVPVLGMLFLLLAMLEDSGYMARIAFVMDRFMHLLGLHGKAFVPLILGFGCNVPGIMATRMLENRRDRILSIVINPFMSCGSRLPTYILFAGIFFPRSQGLVIFSLYALGLLMAILAGCLIRRLVFRELSSPFVIELPAYRLPNWKGVFIHAGEKVWLYIKNAGTIIVAFSVLVWLLANLPMGVAYGSSGSLAGKLGMYFAPLLSPLGFGSWQAAMALIFGVAGKEIIVGTFGTLYGGAALPAALSNDFTPLGAYAFLVFVLLYTPCVATLSTVKRETGSWRWTAFVAAYSTGVAYLAALVVYQVGTALGF